MGFLVWFISCFCVLQLFHTFFCSLRTLSLYYHQQFATATFINCSRYDVDVYYKLCKIKTLTCFSGRTCWTFANWPAIVSDSRQKLCDDDWHFFFSLCGIIGVFSSPCSLCVKRRSCGRRRKPSTRRSERRRELPKSSSWAKPLRRQSRPWLTAVHWTMTATGSCEYHRTNMPPLT